MRLLDNNGNEITEREQNVFDNLKGRKMLWKDMTNEERSVTVKTWAETFAIIGHINPLIDSKIEDSVPFTIGTAKVGDSDELELVIMPDLGGAIPRNPTEKVKERWQLMTIKYILDGYATIQF